MVDVKRAKECQSGGRSTEYSRCSSSKLSQVDVVLSIGDLLVYNDRSDVSSCDNIYSAGDTKAQAKG